MSNVQSSGGQRYNRSEGEELVTTAVVRAVAAAEGVGPLELQPLGRTIDSDALDRLVDSLPDESGDDRELVEFSYAGHVVRVTGDGSVSIDPGDD